MGQLVRFGIAGGLSTLIYSAVYLPLTTWVFPAAHAVYAVPFAFAVAVTAGFFLHSRWSFKGHGSRDRQMQRIVRYAIVSLISFACNSLWVWLLVQHLDLPLWAPYPLVLCVTPLLVFWLNRQWVFE